MKAGIKTPAQLYYRAEEDSLAQCPKGAFFVQKYKWMKTLEKIVNLDFCTKIGFFSGKKL